jgi:hypothetical protein
METVVFITLFVFVKLFPWLILITVGSYWMVRSRGGFTRLAVTRDSVLPEKILTWAGKWLTFLVILELFLTHKDRFTAPEAYWLNLLPLAWLGLSVYRKDIPGDSTANIVGSWTLMPYATFAFSGKDAPDSIWLSVVTFATAICIGIWRELKRPT